MEFTPGTTDRRRALSTRRGGDSIPVPSGRGVRTDPGDCRDPRAQRTGLSTLELCFIAGLVAAVIAAALLSGSHRAVHRLGVTSVKVEAGESLWSVAEAHPVRGLTILETVDLIKQTNRLQGVRVAADSVIDVPAEDSTALALAR